MRLTLQKKKGFTLIELAIVLIVIGLVIGGIVVGRSLIRTSQLQAVLEDVDRYKSAVIAFQSKYNAFPGDFTEATTYWGTKNPNCTSPNYGDQGTLTCNGNGDGMIQNADTDWMGWGWSPDEYLLVWQHLDNAGMIQGHYYGNLAGLTASGHPDVEMGTIVPATKWDAKAGYMFYWVGKNGGFNGADPYFQITTSYRHVILFGHQPSTANANWQDLSAYAALTAAEAKSLDDKIDDGAPGTGKVMGTQNGNSFSPNCTDSTNYSTAQYSTGQTGLTCALVFLTGI